MPKTAVSQTPQELANARADQPGEAGEAAVSAITAAKHPDKVSADYAWNDWPISGDDLALAKAGVIA